MKLYQVISKQEPWRREFFGTKAAANKAAKETNSDVMPFELGTDKKSLVDFCASFWTLAVQTADEKPRGVRRPTAEQFRFGSAHANATSALAKK
tara:strand:- start:1691 stop:1972 length:282 start_codon:yes stop_codon:yes gene_type:complete